MGGWVGGWVVGCGEVVRDAMGGGDAGELGGWVGGWVDWEWVGGGWVGGWVEAREVEEEEAVRMRCCELGIGWVEEEEEGSG